MELSHQYWASLLKSFLAGLLVLPSLCAVSGSVEADRVAAVLEGDVVTLSDLKWFIAFRGFQMPEDPEKLSHAYQQFLDQLIDLKLIESETRNAPFLRVTGAEIEEFVRLYQQHLGDGSTLEKMLSRMGATRRDFSQVVHRRLAVNKFVKLRFEPFTVVLPQEIKDYYTQEYVPELETNRQPVPSFDLVESTIRQILQVRKTNEQLEQWVRGARQKARLSILLFRSPSQAPNLPETLLSGEEGVPVRIERPPGSP